MSHPRLLFERTSAKRFYLGEPMHVFAFILAAAMATATPHSAMHAQHSMMSSHSMKKTHAMKSSSMKSHMKTTHMATPAPKATP
jgi:hypothetical protein